MNNFGQMDPNMMSLFLNPDTAPGAMPAQQPDGLGAVPGMGQIMPKQELKAPYDQFAAANGFGMTGASAGAGAAGASGGSGQMAGILGMEALKGMQSAGAQGPGQMSSQAPLAPRGNQIKLGEEDKANPIDPRMYMMMMRGGVK